MKSYGKWINFFFRSLFFSLRLKWIFGSFTSEKEKTISFSHNTFHERCFHDDQCLVLFSSIIICSCHMNFFDLSYTDDCRVCVHLTEMMQYIIKFMRPKIKMVSVVYDQIKWKNNNNKCFSSRFIIIATIFFYTFYFMSLFFFYFSWTDREIIRRVFCL